MIRKFAFSVVIVLAAFVSVAPIQAVAQTPAPVMSAGAGPTSAPVNGTLPAPITPSAKIDLFNGKDFSGWVAQGVDMTPVAAVWSIKDGSIVCVGKPKGYLRTEASYTQYKCTVEWRFSKAGNTGVMVHINPPDKVWPMCIECQGMHDHQGDFWIWAGAKVDQPLQQRNGVIMKGPSAEKPVGEWNTYQVVCRDDTVTILVNGTEMNKVTGCNLRSGQIGLQSEGAGLEIRKVTIEPLTR